MIPIIDPEEDYLTIAAAEEQMSITEEERRKELTEAQSRIRCQSYRRIPMATSDCSQPACSTRPSPGGSARILNQAINNPISRKTCRADERAGRNTVVADQGYQ